MYLDFRALGILPYPYGQAGLLRQKSVEIGMIYD